jgi:hypothetical protein
MTQTIKSDPNDQSLFSNKGVKELIPPFNFDYKTHEIQIEEVEDVIQRVTECMVNLSASDPRFLYTRKYCSPTIADISGGWEGHRFNKVGVLGMASGYRAEWSP